MSCDKSSVLEVVQVLYKTLNYKHKGRMWVIFLFIRKTIKYNGEKSQLSFLLLQCLNFWIKSVSVNLRFLNLIPVHRGHVLSVFICLIFCYCPSKYEEWVNKEIGKLAISSNTIWNARLIHISGFLLNILKTPTHCFRSIINYSILEHWQSSRKSCCGT